MHLSLHNVNNSECYRWYHFAPICAYKAYVFLWKCDILQRVHLYGKSPVIIISVCNHWLSTRIFVLMYSKKNMTNHWWGWCHQFISSLWSNAVFCWATSHRLHNACSQGRFVLRTLVICMYCHINRNRLYERWDSVQCNNNKACN